MRNAQLRSDNVSEQERIDNLVKFQKLDHEKIREKYDQYEHFMDEYGPKLIGAKEYKTKCCQMTPEEWMTRQEETFCLLSLENYHDAVYQKVHHNKKVSPQWTNVKDAKRNQGYADAGITRYNVIYDVVKKGREKNKFKFGEKYLAEKRAKKQEEEDERTQKSDEKIGEKEKNVVDPRGDSNSEDDEGGDDIEDSDDEGEE